jgi:ankyrin repeat protein
METLEFILSSLHLTEDQVKFLHDCRNIEANRAIQLVKDFIDAHPEDFRRLSYLLFGFFSQNGNLDVVKYMIDNCNISPSLDALSIIYACQKGNFEIVKCLVENGADPSACSDLPIVLSCAVGSLDIVKYLLDNGANVSAMEDMPIVSAMLNGHERLFELLLEYGADPYAQSNIIIKKACLIGHIAILETFLRLGLRIDRNGDVSLSVASALGFTDIMQLLINNGVQPKANNCMAFITAIEAQNTLSLSFLFDSLKEDEMLSQNEILSLLSYAETINLGNLCGDYLRQKLGISFESQFPLDIQVSEECPVCLETSTLILPCRHAVCSSCLLRVSECPMCRLPFEKQYIKRRI